jgi:hypothetical protein
MSDTNHQPREGESEWSFVMVDGDVPKDPAYSGPTVSLYLLS